MAERYFTFELMGFTSDTFDYVGQRRPEPEAGNFAIGGPGWKGNSQRASGPSSLRRHRGS